MRVTAHFLPQYIAISITNFLFNHIENRENQTIGKENDLRGIGVQFVHRRRCKNGMRNRVDPIV